MRRIYVPPARLCRGELALAPDERRYVARVLRLSPGSAVELFDGEGRRAAATLVQVGAREVRCLAEEPREDPPPPGPPLHVGVALLKGERLDLAVRMLTELGVDSITVLTCDRMVARPRAEGSARRERLQRVALAAARQSGRARLPLLAGPSPLDAFAARAEGQRLFGDLDASAAPLPPRSGGDPPTAGVTICTGPEGGFAPEERALLLGRGFRPVALGPHVLRAETAAVVAAALGRAWLAAIG